MKFTLSWLKDHLETDAPLAEIVETLTRIGLEVEGLDDPAARLAGFTIARVIEAKPHPNADRLRVCSVDTGQGAAPVQVVCGAPNARTGMRSVFSPPGTFIPGKKITLGAGRHPRRRVERHALLGGGTRTLRGSRRHHRPARGCAGRRRPMRPMPGSTIRSSTSISRRTAPMRPACLASRATSRRRAWDA